MEFYSGINRKMEVKKEEEIALISFCVLRFHYLLMYASPIVHCGILLSWCLKCSFLKLKIQRILSIQILIFLWTLHESLSELAWETWRLRSYSRWSKYWSLSTKFCRRRFQSFTGSHLSLLVTFFFQNFEYTSCKTNNVGVRPSSLKVW